MKKTISIILFLVMVSSLFLLAACTTSSKLMDKPNRLQSIIITKKSTDEQITLNESQIQEVAQSMSQESIKRPSFQETWNSMGQDTSYEYHYRIAVTTKDSLFSSSKEYIIFLGKTDSEGKDYTFVRRDNKQGDVSVSVVDYIGDLF